MNFSVEDDVINDVFFLKGWWYVNIRGRRGLVIVLYLKRIYNWVSECLCSW